MILIALVLALIGYYFYRKSSAPAVAPQPEVKEEEYVEEEYVEEEEDEESKEKSE